MRTFIYERTHTGDQDKHGCFGVYDCLGKHRGYRFEAVIGIGGIGAEPKAAGIARKLNWVGIGARKTQDRQSRGPLIMFEYFVLFDDKGTDLRAVVPRLAGRMYSKPGPRFVFNDNLNAHQQAEVDRLLQMAKSKPPSSRFPKGQRRAKRGRRARPCRCYP